MLQIWKLVLNSFNLWSVRKIMTKAAERIRAKGDLLAGFSSSYFVFSVDSFSIISLNQSFLIWVLNSMQFFYCTLFHKEFSPLSFQIVFNADLLHSMKYPGQSSITHFCNSMPTLLISQKGDVPRVLEPVMRVKVAFKLNLLWNKFHGKTPNTFHRLWNYHDY